MKMQISTCTVLPELNVLGLSYDSNFLEKQVFSYLYL